MLPSKLFRLLFKFFVTPGNLRRMRRPAGFNLVANPFLLAAIFVCAVANQSPASAAVFDVKDEGTSILVSTPDYHLSIFKKGFRFGFERPDGSVIVAPHAISGLEFEGGDANQTKLVSVDDRTCLLVVENKTGERAEVTIRPSEHHVTFAIKTSKKGMIVTRTGGLSPAFGLGDHGGRGHVSTDLTGYVNNNLHGEGGPGGRLISNFVIFPQAGFAEVNVEPGLKIVRITKDENAQGSKGVTVLPDMVYFFGTPPTIYQDYLQVRTELGYPTDVPKYEWFGVGWEAFGALAYNTGQKTVSENLDHYLQLGFPISWMVIGSGFWPHTNANYQATTSFGMWDATLYPEPGKLIEKYHELGIKVILGLRIAFITEGPFAAEGVKRGYFITENGRPKIFKIRFPLRPVYLLDASKPDAVQWYMTLCQKWLDYGVDGFKEDLFGYENYILRDDKLNAVNAELMKRGIYLMGRNGYLGSPMDLHRYEDFNYDQNQDRGPINGLAFAYSGFPNVYPDIVGGKFIPDIIPQLQTKDGLRDPALKRYFMRNAQYASVNPSMSVGFGPWNFKDNQLDSVVLEAAKLHAQLHPYIYSAAVDAARTGFPFPLTPLTLDYPKDTNVYVLENNKRRGYEWMLGPSLLATPLYGDDCKTANTRNVYLPAGKWMDFDSGKIYEGPQTLKDYDLPPGKTPLFMGGKGVVVRTLPDHTLQAIVYPVATTNMSYQFTFKDGISTSIINNPGQPWKASDMTVVDTANMQPVAFTIDSKWGAIEFMPQAGHDYELVPKSTFR